MPTAEKAKAIEQAADWYRRAGGLVFTEYRGLRVRQLQNLRRELRMKGAELHVIKNTLFRLAAGTDVEKLPEELHNGPTAIAFLFENESAGAKVLLDFSKTSKNLVIKGGYINGRAFSASEVESFSKLPSREVLLAQVIGTIAAPLSQLVGTIEALYADPIRTIGAVADKASEGAPVASAPEPQAEAAPESQDAASESGPKEAAPVTAAEAPEEEGGSQPEEMQPSQEDASDSSETPKEEGE